MQQNCSVHFWFRVSITCLSVLLYVPIQSAENSRIARLGSNNGLSNSSVNTIFQDSLGLMWFGTWDGLNLYNGAEFTNYRPNRTDSSSISNHIIRSIFEEQKGILWITTDYGINRFDLYNNTFKSFYLNYKNRETFRERSFLAARNSKGVIIAATYNSGLYIYHPSVKDFLPVRMKGVNPSNITQLFFDKYDHLWIINDKNEAQNISFRDLTAHHIEILQCNQLSFPKKTRKMCYDGADKIWLQSENNRLAYYSLITNKQLEFTLATPKMGELNAALQANGEYLLATTTGLVKYNPEQHTETLLFPGTSILSLYKGTQDILWIGSDSQGVFQLLPQQHYFSSYTKENIPELGNHAIRSIYRDAHNRLWIGTKGGGLMRISYLRAGKLQQVEKYTQGNGLLSNSVLSIAPASGRNFWIGTDSKGLNYYSFSQNKVKSLEATEHFNPDMIFSVYALLQSNDSTLWVGTSGNGLFKLQLSLNSQDEYSVKSAQHYLFNPEQANSINSNIIYSLVQEGDSLLWVATRGGGLNCLNLQSGQFTVYKNNPTDNSSLSNNDVICLNLNSNNQLLIGTSLGLNLMIRQQNEVIFKRYTETNGLSNNTIHGILEDNWHHIWVSTNRGITRINTAGNTFVHYFFNDGLQDNEFSDGAYLSTPDKQELYFGGVNGFTVFHPGQIGLSSYNPPLFLSSFKIDNKMQPLSHSYKNEIYISYRSSFLSFHFAVLDYISNQKCEIAYKLVRNGNPSESWIYLGTNKNIILSNLTPGKYQLQVKYSNGDYQWSKELFTFPFVVTPPWWNSIYAYLIYALLILMVGYLLFRMQKYRLSMQHKLELEKLDTLKKEEIHQAKLRFFTNIAHEFSNSITLIYGPCERMMDESNLNEKEKNYLHIIKRNAERMQNQIQQLMEFRKAETGYLTMHFEEVDVAEMVKYTLDNFLDIADQKKIELSLSLHPSLASWVVDRDALEKIIFNLLSNAFKYTPQDGKISITLNINRKGLLCFSCTNSGIGISPEDLPFVFNRFRVLDNFESQLSKGVYTRNGIGLALCQNLVQLLNGTISVESLQGDQTTFTVTLPIHKQSKKEQRTVLRKEAEEEKIPSTLPVQLPQPNQEKEGKKNILIIDDQAEIRQLIADILTTKYNIYEAENGITALNVINQCYPDLILCDIIMPVMDGITFLKQLRSQTETKHIPVILLSSKGSIESQIEGLETGADMFLNKPFHPVHLQAMVDRTLDNKAITRDYIESPQAHAEQYNGKLIDKQDKELMNQALHLLAKNLDNEEYNQDALSTDLAISRVQLYRKIKKLTERTPADFIRNFRLQEAEKLLRTTSKTVLEIMNECGFRNKAYFYREFAKVYHCTPKEYHHKAKGE